LNLHGRNTMNAAFALFGGCLFWCGGLGQFKTARGLAGIQCHLYAGERFPFAGAVQTSGTPCVDTSLPSQGAFFGMKGPRGPASSSLPPGLGSILSCSPGKIPRPRHPPDDLKQAVQNERQFPLSFSCIKIYARVILCFSPPPYRDAGCVC